MVSADDFRIILAHARLPVLAVAFRPFIRAQAEDSVNASSSASPFPHVPQIFGTCLLFAPDSAAPPTGTASAYLFAVAVPPVSGAYKISTVGWAGEV
jgi:hypothetical protein